MQSNFTFKTSPSEQPILLSRTAATSLTTVSDGSITVKIPPRGSSTRVSECQPGEAVPVIIRPFSSSTGSETNPNSQPSPVIIISNNSNSDTHFSNQQPTVPAPPTTTSRPLGSSISLNRVSSKLVQHNPSRTAWVSQTRSILTKPRRNGQVSFQFKSPDESNPSLLDGVSSNSLEFNSVRTVQIGSPMDRPRIRAPRLVANRDHVKTVPHHYLNDLSVRTMNTFASASNEPYTKPRKPCNCTRSQCLKLYCDCFSAGEYCRRCNCTNCFNTPDHSDLRQKAVKQCLDRNPNAFMPKIARQDAKSSKSETAESMRRHQKGCQCKKSSCLKNYCECYEAKILCSDMCKCVGCKNSQDSNEPEPSQLTDMSCVPSSIGAVSSSSRTSGQSCLPPAPCNFFAPVSVGLSSYNGAVKPEPADGQPLGGSVSSALSSIDARLFGVDSQSVAPLNNLVPFTSNAIPAEPLPASANCRQPSRRSRSPIKARTLRRSSQAASGGSSSSYRPTSVVTSAHQMITTEVIDAIIDCVLAQASDAEASNLPDEERTRLILVEFGNSLRQLIGATMANPDQWNTPASCAGDNSVDLDRMLVDDGAETTAAESRAKVALFK